MKIILSLLILIQSFSAFGSDKEKNFNTLQSSNMMYTVPSHESVLLNVWTASEYPGVSVGYPSCLKMTKVSLTEKEASDNNSYIFRPSSSCPKEWKTNWYIDSDNSFGDVAYNPHVYKEQSTTVSVNGLKITYYEKESSSTSKNPW